MSAILKCFCCFGNSNDSCCSSEQDNSNLFIFEKTNYQTEALFDNFHGFSSDESSTYELRDSLDMCNDYSFKPVGMNVVQTTAEVKNKSQRNLQISIEIAEELVLPPTFPLIESTTDKTSCSEELSTTSPFLERQPVVADIATLGSASPFQNLQCVFSSESGFESLDDADDERFSHFLSESTFEIESIGPKLLSQRNRQKNIIFESEYTIMNGNEGSEDIEDCENVDDDSAVYVDDSSISKHLMKNMFENSDCIPENEEYTHNHRNQERLGASPKSFASTGMSSITLKDSLRRISQCSINNDYSDFMKLMERGIKVTKYNRKGKPSLRDLYLDRMSNSLYWLKPNAITYNQRLSFKKLFDMDPVSIRSIISVKLASRVTSGGTVFPVQDISRSLMFVFSSRVLNITVDDTEVATKIIAVVTGIQHETNDFSDKLLSKSNRSSFLTAKLSMRSKFSR